jgi:dTDP-4-amino-4,6-dideoxygalactose transaminase
MPKIAAELGQSGIALIEDCAHAHGSTLDGAPAGTFGHAAFSFFPTKVITTFEGGMTVTADPAVAASARSYRDQGKDGSGDYHVVLGNSWRLTKAGAVLGLVQLKWFEDGLARRTEIMNRYRESLGGVLRFPDLGPRDILSGHKAIAFSGKEISREQWRSCAAAGGVSLARDVYAIPLHRQPVFASYAVAGDTFAETDHFCDTHQCLPLWTAMTDAEVARVIDVIGSIAA